MQGLFLLAWERFVHVAMRVQDEVGSQHTRQRAANVAVLQNGLLFVERTNDDTGCGRGKGSRRRHTCHAKHNHATASRRTISTSSIWDEIQMTAAALHRS